MSSLALALIYDPPRPCRALQPDAVARLAIGIERIGLRTPISVRPASRIRDGKPADVWEIVAGRHRVAAARKLGWTEIEAVIMEGDATDARLWEIAENLHRADLTVQERAEHIAEWVKLTGEKTAGPTWADSLPDGRKAGPQHQKRGINAAVRELGIERHEAQRAVKIAALAPEAKEAAREAKLDDNQSALLRAASKPTPAAQVAFLEEEASKRQAAAIAREEERRRIRDAEEGHKLNQKQEYVPEAKQIVMEEGIDDLQTALLQGKLGERKRETGSIGPRKTTEEPAVSSDEEAWFADLLSVWKRGKMAWRFNAKDKLN